VWRTIATPRGGRSGLVEELGAFGAEHDRDGL
jgi:hypothetical protein